MIPLWGMIGIWTTKLGYATRFTVPSTDHTDGRLRGLDGEWHGTGSTTSGSWAYNVVFGLFQAPYYAFSQTMMAELTPPGFDNMVRPLPSPSLHSLLPLLLVR